jgi:hypothetical protein
VIPQKTITSVVLSGYRARLGSQPHHLEQQCIIHQIFTFLKSHVAKHILVSLPYKYTKNIHCLCLQMGSEINYKIYVMM